MKKILSLLTISTLTASVPAPLMAMKSSDDEWEIINKDNIPTPNRVKRNVSTLLSNSNNDYLPLNKINGINEATAIAVDSSNNIYFAINKVSFVLKQGETTPTKINDIIGIINSIVVDKNNNVYFGTSDGLFVLKQGETTPTKIDGVSYALAIAVDSKDNIYFGTDKGAYVLEQGKTTPTKIDGVSYALAIAVDSKDNIYFGTDKGAYVLKQGKTTPTKINGIDFVAISIGVDSSNNIYLGVDKGAYMLKQGETTPTKINGVNGRVKTAVDSKDNIYLGTDNGVFKLQSTLSWVKTNINVNLVEIAKNIAWLRDDQLVANGQVKVKMANTNIKTVKVNDKEMSQTNKVWEFDLPTDSTTVENKDYKIEVVFTLDKKSYVGQIIVSSLLSQPSINVKKNTSVIGNVDSYVYQVPTNGKVGDITLTSDLYYSDTEIKVSLNKPTSSTNITAQIFGLDEKWEKNKKVFQIFDNQTYNLDGSQLDTYQGRYLIEKEDNATNKSSYYVVINKDNLTPNFWDTTQGQQFYEWANLNGYNDSIKKLNATELNKIIKASANWQQLASDSQFATAVADWFKTNGKLLSKEPLTKEQVVEQLKTQVPSIIKIPDVNTNNYDVNKVSFELEQSEFKPNDKVNITVKYNNAQAEQFTLQIKDSNTPDNNKKGGLGIWSIFGIVVGSLAGLVLLGWLFKKFVVDPFILGPIRDKKQKAWRIREDKALAEIEAEESAQQNKWKN